MVSQEKGNHDFSKVFEKIFIASYVFCAVLIIYSLMLFNLSWAGGAINNNRSEALNSLPRDQTLTVPVLAYMPNVTEVWLQTAFFAESAGGIINNAFDGTIQLYSDGLTKLFVATGHILGAIPDILASPPAFARIN